MKLILKSGTSIKVNKDEAETITHFLMNRESKDRHLEISRKHWLTKKDVFRLLVKCDEVAAIVN